MTKRIAGIAIAAAAAVTFALPAAPAAAEELCIPFGTFTLYCVPPVVN